MQLPGVVIPASLQALCLASGSVSARKRTLFPICPNVSYGLGGDGIDSLCKMLKSVPSLEMVVYQL